MAPPHTLIPLLQTHSLHRLALGAHTHPNYSALATIARFRYSTTVGSAIAKDKHLTTTPEPSM
ncbi:hypothetical protein K439DRAFT_1637231, partial [Ramaria rubella]